MVNLHALIKHAKILKSGIVVIPVLLTQGASAPGYSISTRRIVLLIPHDERFTAYTPSDIPCADVSQPQHHSQMIPYPGSSRELC